jgi:carboxymethylenebutenolidase
MGEMIEFASNGTNGQGYLAKPAGGTGPGLVVFQEWWGLVPHITDLCDRFAASGFVALAPDMYRGEKTKEPDEAGKLMMAMNLERAAKDMSGAVDAVLAASGGSKAGVTGFCMGGGLALVLACLRNDAVAAVAPFYGLVPWPEFQPDYSRLNAAVQGHYAELDGYFGPAAVHDLEATLRGLGKSVEMFIYDGCDHAFFNDTRPEVYNAEAAKLAWDRTVAFFRSQLS